MLVNALRRQNIFSTRRCYSSSSTASPPYRILFCGTDAFARTTVAALHDAKDVCSALSVVTARDAPNTWQSRKRAPVSLVKLWAQEADVPLEVVPKEGGIEALQLPSTFETASPNDLLLTASFGHLLPASLLNRFPPSQRLNLHPSLLPHLSGAAPIQWAIARQMTSTGISIQTLGEKFDSGSILAQEEVAIPSQATYEALEEDLAKLGSQLIVKVLRDLPNLAANAWPQSSAPSHLLPSKAPKLRSAFSRLNWSKWTSSDIVARRRAFGYLYPLKASISQFRLDSVLLREVNVIKDISSFNLDPNFLDTNQPGAGVFSPQTQSIIVKCKDGQSLLNVTRLQSEGKREMEAAKWIVGYRSSSHKDSLLLFE